MNEKVEKVASASGAIGRQGREGLDAKGGHVVQGGKERPCPLFFVLTYLFRERERTLKDLLL